MKYEITIRTIENYQVPETEYTKTEKLDKNGEPKYAYIETGRMLDKENVKEIFSQIVEQLDIPELVKLINK